MADKFTKSDFVSAHELAKKTGKDIELIKKTMREHFKKGTKILENNTKHDLIYNAKWIHTPESKSAGAKLRVHPLGIKVFMEILNNTK